MEFGNVWDLHMSEKEENLEDSYRLTIQPSSQNTLLHEAKGTLTLMFCLTHTYVMKYYINVC